MNNRHYELVLVLDPAFGEKVGAFIAESRALIEDNGGSVSRFEEWGVRKLAYQIRKKVSGAYFLFNFSCLEDSSIIEKLNQSFFRREMILRSLVLRRSEAPTGSTVIYLDKQRAEEARRKASEESKAAEALREVEIDKTEASASSEENRSESASNSTFDDNVVSESPEKFGVDHGDE